MTFLKRSLTVATLASAAYAAPFLGQLIERDDQLNATYSYVITGGGTAGLALANRLTEDPEITVLVLEAGIPDPKQCADILQRCIGDTISSPFDWNITTAPNEELTGTSNHQQHLAIGKALGGSSLLNGMMFDRPSPADLDAWAALGNEGWDWESLLPYYIKSETFTPPSQEQIDTFGITWDPSVHGDSGYLSSSYPNFIYPQNKNLQDAMISVGIKQSKDQAGSAIGTFWSPVALDHRNQTRSYSRSKYYDPFIKRENLHAITSRHVTRLLTSSSDGVVYVTGVEYAVEGNPKKTLTATATKEYILSAGSVHDPQILQLSGIGGKSLLDSLEIPVVVDLPGVGNNFQDHPFSNLILHLDNVAHSPIDLDQNTTWDAEQKALFYENRTGAWTYGAPTSVAFLPYANYSTNASGILELYASQTADQYLRPGLDGTLVAGFAKQRDVLLENLATTDMAAMEFIWLSGANRAYQTPFSVSIMHPFSRGFIEINSTDPFDPPVASQRMFSNPGDAAAFPDAFRFARKLVATPFIQELAPAEMMPGSNVTSDADLIAYSKDTATTMFHPVGTASMQPLEHGGVVDAELKVYGVSNLRVVDASIFPLIPATHTQATVYAVAEKAADLIKAAQ